MTHRVVIVGGGFAGLNVAQGLRRSEVSVTVLDRQNYHLFQPLLYQVATGGLSPGDITSPIRNILSRNRNTSVLQAEVSGVDLAGGFVTASEQPMSFDTLVVATGATHHYFGRDGWQRFAPGLKTIEDATTIRRRVLDAFERAEYESLRGHHEPGGLTFVVIGAGPTGVELAGAIAELARDTLRHDFRAIDPSSASIFLLEGTDRVLPGYPPSLSERARRSLERLGVIVRLNTMVSDIDADGVTLDTGKRPELLPSRCVLWGAGVKASPLGEMLCRSAGIEPDRAGRVPVRNDLTLPGHPEVFVIGDLASLTNPEGRPVPGVAPAAMQQGKYVARMIRDRLRGKTAARPFRYVDKGNLATIGRKAAVADFGRLRFSGFPAWMLWLGVHLFFLVGFENRVMVFLKWAVNYFSRNRGARLIVGRDPATEE